MVIRNKEFYERQNKIIEKLAKSNLAGSDLKYCLVVFRKTFGYGKYEDRISRSQIAEMTRMAEVHVSRTGKRLKKRRILIEKGKIKGFNLNTNTWEKVPMRLPFKKVPKLVLKGTNQAEKKGTNSGTYKETTKKLPKEGGLKSMKMRWKEIDKLEGKPWLRATMINQGTFDIKFIKEVLSKHTFTELYDCWLELQEAYKVRDKKAWFLAKLQRGPEEEE